MAMNDEVTVAHVRVVGTEEDARIYAAELVGLDPKTTKVFTIKPPKSFVSKFLPGGSENAIARFQFEAETSGMPLWMWR